MESAGQKSGNFFQKGLSRPSILCVVEGGAEFLAWVSQRFKLLDLRTLNESIEVIVICSHDAIDVLASRIELAYRRRFPRWLGMGLTPRVWESAASRLMEATVERPKIPIDPELYVAIQPRTGTNPDPWAELTQRRSLQRYLRSLRRIVGQLRKELKTEVRRAESQFLAGMSLEEVLSQEEFRITPLTRYILAYRAGRHDLSSMYRAAAENQHRSCPLYRLASRCLLPGHAYPSADPAVAAFEIASFSLN